MSKILEKKSLGPGVYQMKIEAPHIVKKIKAGQFVIVMSDEKGERIPLSVCDWDRTDNSLTLIFYVAGVSTLKLSEKNKGESLHSVVGPLGHPSEIENFGVVLCAGGCYGVGAIYPIIRELKEKGNYVIASLEQRSKVLHYWVDKIKAVADRTYIVTSDGSYGIKGHNDLVIKQLVEDNQKIDRVIAIGCTWMMKVCSDATRGYGIKTIVALNPIMIDGTGMCGVCRVSVGGETKFTCVDGPEFDGHLVDWELLLSRRHMYFNEEIYSFHRYECEKYG